MKKETYWNNNLVRTQHYVRNVAGQTMAIYTDLALAEQPVYGAGRIGVAYNGINDQKTYLYELTDHLGNIRATFVKVGNEPNIHSWSDYYPFGSPMPGRNIVGNYRYAFQGQEKDPETGIEAFELRLWDSRIGRWLTTDPYGQYSSPYVGMGNDPINGIDSDGGWRWKLFAKWARNRAVKAGLDPGELYKSNGEWGFNTSSVTSGFTTDADATATFNFTDAWKNSIPAQIRPTSDLQNFQFWRNEAPTGGFDLLKHAGAELTFGTADNFKVLFTGRHIGGASPRGYNSMIDAKMDGFLTIATLGMNRAVKLGTVSTKSSVLLFSDFASYTKGLFKGTYHAQLRAKAYRDMLNTHDSRIKETWQNIDDFMTQETRFRTLYQESQKE
ncbi:RHS repeat-associated core domain-containing protein [Flagellimonas sp. 389]|uniref:RHS repeat-associated core domain-containing protein n=1 Tax=Flagellimonas sp. 389 TaxID=2835862 RepID=UPI001BD23F27|nr:RHS repeat-associated core domain-containing protein [uncultured Allomuricauda sp.]MBS9463652.1 RHS repeat-associated core domain-containing protein [Flagellimonas sp. 389]